VNRNTKPRSRTQPIGSKPSGIKTRASKTRAVKLRCSYCHDDVSRDDRRYCAECMAPHHGECWDEHGACSASGCGDLEWVQSREGTSTPQKRRRKKRGPKRGLSRGRIESEANTALVLGIVALVACGLAGPFAISKANEVTRQARQARIPVPGAATGGLVMGWLGTVGVLLSLGIVVLQLGFVFGA
jgi:predicted small lipoprotein YifL